MILILVINYMYFTNLFFSDKMQVDEFDKNFLMIYIIKFDIIYRNNNV
jgi:hypothetical protein